jgi:hypothetical protein
MSWIEFLVRVFGGLVVVVLFLSLKEIWDRWTEKRGK